MSEMKVELAAYYQKELPDEGMELVLLLEEDGVCQIEIFDLSNAKGRVDIGLSKTFSIQEIRMLMAFFETALENQIDTWGR